MTSFLSYSMSNELKSESRSTETVPPMTGTGSMLTGEAATTR